MNKIARELSISYLSEHCVQAKLLQSCPTLCSPMDYSPPSSSVHGILQARILEWVATPSSKGSSWLRDRTHNILCLLQWQVGRLPQVPHRKPHISEWPRTNIFLGSSVGKESTWNTGDPGSTPGSGRSTAERISHPFQYSWATPVARLIKNLPAMGETWVLLPQSLSRGSSYWQGCSHEKACLRLDSWQISASCFQVASVPCNVASSQGPWVSSLTWQLPQSDDPRANKEEAIMPSMN